MSRRSEHTTKVFVGSLPPNVTTDDLRQLFASYGAIAECDIANRCGFLHLEDRDLAMKAIADLNNTTFMGGRISVEKGRVKPRGDRRMRNSRGGGSGGGGGGGGSRKRDSGPYSRDGGYRRDMQRNGNYGRGDYDNFDGYRGGEFGRGYEEGYERRPMYDDRRGGSSGGGYMSERRAFDNGFDRRQYPDDRAPYSDARGQFSDGQRGGFDDRRMQAGPGNFDDRRASMNERRPLIEDGGMGQNSIRAPMNNYERAPGSSDMFSRRDNASKQIRSGGYERSSQGYTTNYSSGTPALNSYSTTAPIAGYTSTSGGYSQMQQSGYTDNNRGSSSYMDGRQQNQSLSAGYTTQNYSTQSPSGGYGDNYGVRGAPQANAYDSAYPPLPQQQQQPQQQRGFAGGNPPGPHRDMPPARRYN